MVDQSRALEKGDDLSGRYAGVLGVAAVEGAAHAAHHGHDLLADGELSAGARGDDTGGFDAQHPREGHTLGEAEAGMQLGTVESEGLDLDEHPAGHWDGARQYADGKGLRWSWGVQDDGSHGLGH